MKALVLTGVGELEIQDILMSEPLGDEVIVNVKACGICGTDRHIFGGGAGASDNPLPIVLGHEFSGVVEAVGPDVRGFVPGDRVSVDPNCACGKCYYCHNGKAHFCEDMTWYGTQENGGFAEKCKVHEKVLYKLPDNVSFEEGAMVEPVSCCLHGMDLCKIAPGDTVAIIGCGAIGQIMIQLAKLAGAASVIAVEPVAERRETALEFGADMGIDPISQDVQKILRENGYIHIDKVIECVGRRETMEMAVELAALGGTVMLFGLTGPGDVMEVKPFELFKKELKILTSFINPYTFSRVIDLMAAKKLDLLPLITDKISLADSIEAFTRLQICKTGENTDSKLGTKKNFRMISHM